MADTANILVVSDLHFGEELLPGATADRREAVELGAQAFAQFLRYHRARRLGGRPWRLVIAGDLFDFMSVVIPGVSGAGGAGAAGANAAGANAGLAARNHDERRLGLGRGARPGVRRLAAICARHGAVLGELAAFAAAGHAVDVIVGNHDVELLEPDVIAELHRQIAAAAQVAQAAQATQGANVAAYDAAAAARIRVVSWFVYEPGVAWIEHGHVYDEGCSFEFNLAPGDPAEDRYVSNADYAAIRYLAMASPELDPHGIEEWSFGGFLQYAWGRGPRPFARLIAAYGRFMFAMIGASLAHGSTRRRRARRALHAERLAEAATRGGVELDTARAIDRLARAPLTMSWQRVARLLVLDKWAIAIAAIFAMVICFAITRAWWKAGVAGVAVVALGLVVTRGKHMVTSQLPMRFVPQRLRALVDAPVVVFGHTHDPRWQLLDRGGVYVNSGTWLPAVRPGLRRSFTHAMIQPRDGQGPIVELRQWRDGASLPFDARDDIGAGVSSPRLPKMAS